MVGGLQRRAGQEEEAGDLSGLRIGEASEILVERARRPGLEADALALGIDVEDEGQEARGAGADGEPGGGAVEDPVRRLRRHGRRIATVGRRNPSRSCATVRRSGRKPARR